MAAAVRRSTMGSDDDFFSILDTIHRKFSHIRLDERRSLTPDVDIYEIQNLLPHNKDNLLFGVNSDVVQYQYNAVVKLRKYLSLENISLCIDNTLSLNITGKLIELLQCEHCHDLQYETAWVLTNICAGSTEQTAQIITAGAISILILLLRSPCVDVRIQACWCLGNIAGDSPKFRDLVINADVVDAFLYMHEVYFPSCEQLSSDNLQAIRISTWTIANLCRGVRPHPNWDKLAPLCKILTSVIFTEDHETLVDACWAITRIMHGEPQHVQELISHRVCQRLLELVKVPVDTQQTREDYISLQSPALRAITNIVSGTESSAQVLIDCDGITVLKDLLTSPHAIIRRESLLALSNVGAGTIEQVRELLSKGVGVTWVAMLKSTACGVDDRQRREVMWSMSNATSLHDFEIARYFVFDLNCIMDVLPYLDPAISVDLVLLEKAADTILNLLISGERYPDSFSSTSQLPITHDPSTTVQQQSSLLISTEFIPMPLQYRTLPNPFITAFPSTTLDSLDKIRNMVNLDYRIRRKCDKLLKDLQQAAAHFDEVMTQMNGMSLSVE